MVVIPHVAWQTFMATRTKKQSSKKPQSEEIKQVAAEVVTEGDSEAITPVVEEASQVEPLTAEEKERLAELENTFCTSLNTAAFALKEISDRKLYRETHRLFEDYCEEQLQISRRFASYQINFARIIEEFEKEQDVPFLPTSESQVRALAKLEPEERKALWLKSCKKAGNKVPSRETVQLVIKQIRQQEEGYEPIETGACVVIVRASKESLKGYAGYWGFVESVSKKNTYTITLPEKTLRGVPREDLQEVSLEPDKLALRKELFEQLQAIYGSNENREPVVEELLAYFGKKREEAFTSLEKEILGIVREAVKASPAKDDDAAVVEGKTEGEG